MKKIIFSILIIILFLNISACSKNDDTDEITLNLNKNNILEITVSTQMTDPKQDVILNEDDLDNVVNKLNSFSLAKVDAEDENGWQYLFNIKEKDDLTTLISFMDDKVTIDGTIYTLKGYNNEDFLYLFE